MARDHDRITEQVNPETVGLDRLESGELIERILREDERVPAAVRASLGAMREACDKLTQTLQAGGRWFNLGAGTSGRIGVLDAAELPPTYGLDPGRVEGLIAGGEPALTRAVEGAEDDASAGIRDLTMRNFNAKDCLLGLSASGETPYVLGAIEHARNVGASTIALTCNPDSALATVARIAIVPAVGPEAIAGSTRMKGGLAQKMVMAALSTAVMVRLGRVRGNRMTHLQPLNRKLKGRAVATVCEIAWVTPEVAEQALESAGSIESALKQLGR